MTTIPDPEVLDILIHLSGADDERLRDWIRNYQSGLRPYAGAWRSRDEIAALRARPLAQSLVPLLEAGVALVALLAVDVVLFILIRGLFF